MHIPVLVKEVIEHLNPQANENFIDGTFGWGGHSQEILKRNKPEGEVLGIEWDKSLYQRAKKEKIDRLNLVHENYANVDEIVKRERFADVSGILLDLGMSSWHLEHSGRGFSFKREEPLDMRFNEQRSLTAEVIVNTWLEEDIVRILRDWGQERFAKLIAAKIVESRRHQAITTTLQLAEIVKSAFPRRLQNGRIHPSTRTFQALRIAVNAELENLADFLPQAIETLTKGGRLVIISFHSLEDRVVKNFFKEQSLIKKLQILTKKPIVASESEINSNPRARSAKLRAALKL